MFGCKLRLGFALVAVLAAWPFAVRDANATVVEFQTSLGNFRVNLYDTYTPATVRNFLRYVNSGRYTNTVIHSSQEDFVIQGGGYTYDGGLPLDEILTYPPVEAEQVLSNVRGTIGMARRGNRRNSATSQWFFNVDDNQNSLDWPNGGYAVFGVVEDDGMDIVDAIAALPNFDIGSRIDDIPLRDYTEEDLANGAPIDENNLVIINAIVVIDTTEDTAAGLDPPPNTATDRRPPPLVVEKDRGSGSTSLLLLLVIGLVGLLRRRGA